MLCPLSYGDKSGRWGTPAAQHWHKMIAISSQPLGVASRAVFTVWMTSSYRWIRFSAA